MCILLGYCLVIINLDIIRTYSGFSCTGTFKAKILPFNHATQYSWGKIIQLNLHFITNLKSFNNNKENKIHNKINLN